MKRFQIYMCVFAIAILFSTEAMAQGNMSRMMRMMGGGGVQLDSSLLAIEKVREELNFTDDQTEKIAEKAADLNSQMQTGLRDIMMSGGDEAEIKELTDELMEEEKEIVAMLDDDQKKRLSQLKYQRMGRSVYQDEQCQKDLEFSEEQVESVNEAFEGYMEDLQSAFTDARESGDMGSIRQTMTDLAKELDESLVGFLNDDQKKKLEEMKGEEFDFPQPQRRGRGGRGNRSDF